MNFLKKRINRQNIAWLLTAVGMVIFLAVVFLLDWNKINSYTAYNTYSLEYVKARVVSVDSQNLEKDDTDPGRYLGTQQIQVEILEGEFKGQTVSIENYLTRTLNVFAREGGLIVVCADVPDNAQPLFTVFNYYRVPAVWIIIAAFALMMIVIGRGKGVRALIGLAFTVLTVLFFMVQGIYHGLSPVIVSIFTAAVTAAVSLILLNGWSRKTLSAAVSTTAGVAMAGLLFAGSSALLHISGYNTDAAQTLLLVSRSTGLSIKNLIFAATLIASLGAVMDVGMSISSALYELSQANRKLTRRQLFSSGMQIGRDMIGTMSNTLILAYVGTSLSTMLSLLAYGYELQQLVNSDYLAVELAQGLCSTMGVILTVPIASAVSSAVFRREK